MRHLNGVYALIFNKMVDRDGPVFRGRYKAILIESEPYLLNVSRYIHLNPVDAKIVAKAEQYRWSSYRNYIFKFSTNWLSQSYILEYFGNVSAYAEFVGEGIDEELLNFYALENKQVILGTKKFSAEKIHNLEPSSRIGSQTDINKVKKNILNIEMLLQAVTSYFEIDSRYLMMTMKHNYPRMLAIYLARKLLLMTHAQIAHQFSGINRGSVSSCLRRCKDLLSNNTELQKKYEDLVRIING